MSRGGPVVFADPGGCELKPGQLVVVDLLPSGATNPPPQPFDRLRAGSSPARGEGEAHPAGAGSAGPQVAQPPALATVVFTSDQLVETEVEITPAMRVVRVATAQDAVAIGRRMAAEADVLRRAAAACSAVSLATHAVDAWLSPDGARVFITLGGDTGQPSALVRALEDAFGLPVELQVVGPAGLSTISGPLGAGLPVTWTEWLAEPETEPFVRPLGEAAPATARDLIDRLFPPEERAAWARPRPRPET